MAGLFTVTSNSTKNISIGQLDEFMDWAMSNGAESMTPAQALSVPLAFRAVDMIAGAVSRMPYYVIDAEKNDVTDELTPRYWKELTYKLCASLLIYNGAYCLKETNQFGLNAKWRFLPSPLMSWSTTSENEIDYFEYKSNPPDRIADFEKRLLWWWWPNLQSEIGPGAGPMNAALGDIGLSSSLTKFAEAYFARGGFPLTLLQGPNLGPGVGEKVLSWWNSMIAGAKRAFRAIILDEKIKVNTIGTSIKDTIAPELYMQAAHNVAIAFGIPLSLLMSDAANYATALEDHVRLYTETVIPIHERMIEVWNERVYEPRGYTIEGNPDDLEIMQSYQLQQAASVMALVGKPILTLDEGREMLGYEPIGKDSVEPPTPDTTSTAPATPAIDDAPAQDAQPADEHDDAIANERKRLKRYAHNRITDGKPFKFTSDVIGLPEIESVKALASHEAIDAVDLGAIVGARRDDLAALIETINAARAELKAATNG